MREKELSAMRGSLQAFKTDDLANLQPIFQRRPSVNMAQIPCHRSLSSLLGSAITSGFSLWTLGPPIPGETITYMQALSSIKVLVLGDNS